MIPLTIAGEIRSTLLDYLATTFNFQDQAVEHALLSFLQGQGAEGHGSGMFQGPYIHLRLPFRKILPEELPPLEIAPNFIPYVHQLRAIERLSSRYDHEPQPTIITTGTGSGKTECFLFPILDHCFAHRDEPGIKAIILYPMNALAGDQARRLASILWNDERLKGRVTAGMYVGGQGETAHKVSGPNHLVDDRAILRQNPPDILLTNYKMLDFLLLRPEDRGLWAKNSPETLRYLVLDELHTYDGAQGSDVACLVRRLKARLGTPKGYLCPIGTSATVAGEDQQLLPFESSPSTVHDGHSIDTITTNALTDFAGQIFDESFSVNSVIGESRVNLAEFLPLPPALFDLPEEVDGLREQPGEPEDAYLSRQMQLWFAQQVDPYALADLLGSHNFLRSLISSIQGEIVHLDSLCQRLGRWEPEFAALSFEDQQAVLDSFLALIAHARVRPENQDDEPQPFLTLQVQLWIREMSRLMREVYAEPRFFWRDDVPLQSKRRGLPAYYCRECGHSGWLSMMRDGDYHLTDDPSSIYYYYFERHKNVRYVFQNEDQSRLPGLREFLCPQCLSVSTKEKCPYCHTETFPVTVHRELSQPRTRPGQAASQPRDLQRCPSCGSDNALSIVGSQAASLSAVAISHLYTSPLNDDKKLLAFTDSVQDAAHRAAFFGARTYRFNLRTAIQAVLENSPDEAIPLDQFTTRMLDHWQSTWHDTLPEDKKNRAGQKVVATFMPPDLYSLPSYQEFMEGPVGPIPSQLKQDLNNRLSWEVTMAYGFNARLGRSLENAGSSVAIFDRDRLRPAIEQIFFRLPEEFGQLHEIEVETIRHFVTGLLERTRVRGGVVHSMLTHYAVDQGNWYLLTKKMQPLLSPFYKRSPRFPRFLTNSSRRDVFDQYLTSGGALTWYVDWAQRGLANSLDTTDINDIYHCVIDELVKANILKEFKRGKDSSYGIEPAALLVTKYTELVSCDSCQYLQTVTPETIESWLGQTCLRYRCPGHYQPASLDVHSYYRALYERGNVERIFSHEHTGLLEREIRESLETQFKDQTRADSANLLVATPTLEMGIDIGDLSATMACAIPPSTANYLQRIGRAGRKTGNSLVIALANAQPHDLYFFGEPLEMIAGAIVPPGCFLDAPNMLKRQYLAFAMDTWAANDPRAQQLPRKVKDMLARIKRGGFPEDLLMFYEQNQIELIDKFLDLFGDVVSSDNQAQIREFATSGELPHLVRSAITEAEEKREELRNTRKALRKEQTKIEADRAEYEDPDQEIKDLEREIKLLLAMIQAIEEKYILNFFTDAGLLPNYAFPESGVHLRAVITGVPPVKGEEPGYIVKEYVRPAPVAIRELAPFNTFYAEGRKVMVNFLDVTGRKDIVERWQFCNCCSYMESVATSHYSATCPACGSELWRDTGQQHDVVRLQEATARTEHQQSLAGDQSDDREREAYETGRYFDIHAEYSQGANLIPDMPFGFEFHTQVTLREFNFGPAGAWGSKVQIADEDRPEEGFQVCPGCGLIKDTRPSANGNGQTQHARNCTVVGRGRRSTNGNVPWHNLYLYREMTSEALRILLPVSTVFVGEKLATFEACLNLGLRRKFRGDPGHLQILPHVEVAADGQRRRFLVIYDAVPGGTSFLRDLARPDEFRRVLELALETLTSCRCRLDPDKQACYRCLYSFRSQYELELISRQLGVEMLQEIFANWSELTTVDTLSGIPMDSLIESELEQRFVDALSQHAEETDGCIWRPKLHKGKQSWELLLNGKRWLVEPQVILGHSHGVAKPSKPDFVFWPQSTADDSVLPVAVFADGFAYHVRPNQPKGQLADDLEKRRALMESGRFRIWAITWDDVQYFKDKLENSSSFLNQVQYQFLDGLLKKFKNGLSARLTRQDGVSQILRYLQEPDLDNWVGFTTGFALACMVPTRPPIAASLLNSRASALLSESQLPDLSIPDKSEPGDNLYGILQKQANHLLIFSQQQALQAKDPNAFTIRLRLDDSAHQRGSDGFLASWQNFLTLNNLFQFLPGFVPTSTEYIQQFGPALSEPKIERVTKPSLDYIPESWAETLEYADEECTDLLHACITAEVPPPIVGYELVDGAGRVQAMAELAWKDHEAAVFLSDQAEDQQSFEKAGWQVFNLDETDVLLAALMR